MTIYFIDGILNMTKKKNQYNTMGLVRVRLWEELQKYTEDGKYICQMLIEEKHKQHTQEFKREWNEILEEILLLALQGKAKL